MDADDAGRDLRTQRMRVCGAGLGTVLSGILDTARGRLAGRRRNRSRHGPRHSKQIRERDGRERLDLRRSRRLPTHLPRGPRGNRRRCRSRATGCSSLTGPFETGHPSHHLRPGERIGRGRHLDEREAPSPRTARVSDAQERGSRPATERRGW